MENVNDLIKRLDEDNSRENKAVSKLQHIINELNKNYNVNIFELKQELQKVINILIGFTREE